MLSRSSRETVRKNRFKPVTHLQPHPAVIGNQEQQRTFVLALLPYPHFGLSMSATSSIGSLSSDGSVTIATSALVSSSANTARICPCEPG